MPALCWRHGLAVEHGLDHMLQLVELGEQGFGLWPGWNQWLYPADRDASVDLWAYEEVVRPPCEPAEV